MELRSPRSVLLEVAWEELHASRNHSHPSRCHQHRPGYAAGALHCQITVVWHILRDLVVPLRALLGSPFPSLASVSGSAKWDFEGQVNRNPQS